MSQIDLLQTREPGGHIVDSIMLILRQTAWGKINGETLIEMHRGEEDGSTARAVVGKDRAAIGTADHRVLLSLAHAALVMAEEWDIAKQIVLGNRPSATKGEDRSDHATDNDEAS